MNPAAPVTSTVMAWGTFLHNSRFVQRACNARVASGDFFDAVGAGFAIASAGARTHQIGAELLAVMAHPADAPRWHASHQRKWLHIIRHHRAGSDERILA